MPQYSRAYCVPAQPSMCHNTVEPTVCLLNLLCATIQPSLLCAYSAFYVPQYSRAYNVLAQPSMCHNTTEPTVCLLRLLYACSAYQDTTDCFVTHCSSSQPLHFYHNIISCIATLFPSHASPQPVTIQQSVL